MVKIMRTFNYESHCVKYRDCFFDIGKYEKNKISLAIYGYIGNDKNISYISNVTVNVDDVKMKENQIVIDDYANTNLITFLMELGIVKRFFDRVVVTSLRLALVEVDLDKLKEYCYIKEELKKAS